MQDDLAQRREGAKSLRSVLQFFATLRLCARFATNTHFAHCRHVAGDLTRARTLNLPSPRGWNTTTSASDRSTKSLPAASMRFGLWLTMMVFLPPWGGVESNSRSALARRWFSFGETTRPPSLTSIDVVTGPTPSNLAASWAR